MMKFHKDTFLNLDPKNKTTRPKFEGYKDLCLKQNSKSYSVQYEYKSPTQQGRRWFTLQTFNYTDNINKKMLDNVLKTLDINRGKVAQGIDPRAEADAKKEVILDRQILISLSFSLT